MERYFATAAKGIEQVTADELRRLGASNIEAVHGGVHFGGGLEVLYRANLWLRTGSRILVPLRDFAAKTPEMLYDQARRIKWEQIVGAERTIAVDATISGLHSGKDEERASRPPRGRFIQKRPSEKGLTHSHYAALKIKDAIVDQLRLKLGTRPNVDVANPDVRIHAYFNAGRCTLSLDASGASLHERGYRLKGARAPLKENLAAAIVWLTGWDGKTPFVDPMCGSGTLVLEAALMALDIAPGLYRKKFGFFGWSDFDSELWNRLVEEAQEKAQRKPAAPIVGYDHGRDVVASALENSKRAGLTRMVHFEKRDIETLEPVGNKPGTVVVNPPYGERLGEVKELAALYKLIGDLFKQRMKGWTGFIFTGNTELAKSVGLRASKRIALYNGPIECRLLRYELY